MREAVSDSSKQRMMMGWGGNWFFSNGLSDGMYVFEQEEDKSDLNAAALVHKCPPPTAPNMLKKQSKGSKVNSAQMYCWFLQEPIKRRDKRGGRKEGRERDR